MNYAGGVRLIMPNGPRRCGMQERSKRVGAGSSMIWMSSTPSACGVPKSDLVFHLDERCRELSVRLLGAKTNRDHAALAYS